MKVHGLLRASTATDSALVARSVVVHGNLSMGTVEDPIPAGVTASVELWGDDEDHTVVVTEGLFAGSKTMVVMGTLSMVGTGQGPPSDIAWTKLAATAVDTATIEVKGDQTWWPVGGHVGVSATEYPGIDTTETEVRTIVAPGPTYDPISDITTVQLDTPLQHRHCLGPLGLCKHP